MGFLNLVTLRDEIYIDTPCSGELADAGAEILKSYASIPKAEYDQARKQAGKKKPGYNADNSYSFVGFFGAELERCKAVLSENVTRDQLPKAFRFPSCSNATLISPSFVDRLEINIVALDNGQLKFETTFGFKSWHSKTVHDGLGLPDLHFGYAGNVPVKGVVKDFLTFALSGSNYTFQNLTSTCVTIDFCTDANKAANLPSIVEAVNQTIQANQNKCFACPAISVFVIKDGSPEQVLSTRLREWGEEARNAYSTMGKMSVYYRRLSNGYLADGVLYNTCSDMRTFATVEGKCIEDVYVAIGKALENALAKAQMEEQGGASNILFGDEEEPEPEQTDADDTDGFDGAFEGDEISFGDSDETGDALNALAKGETARLMRLYSEVYASGDYDCVALCKSKTTDIVSGISADGLVKYGMADFGFTKEKAAVEDEALFTQFGKAGAHLWQSLRTNYALEAKTGAVSQAIPRSKDDLSWLVKYTQNNRPTVEWFPLLHLTLVHGVYPWEIKKIGKVRHSWDELSSVLEKWFIAVFTAVGEVSAAKKGLDAAESDIKTWGDTFARHFVVGRDRRSFRFSVYWKEDAVLQKSDLMGYFGQAGVKFAASDKPEDLEQANVMLTVMPSARVSGLVGGTFMPDLKGYLGQPFLGYEAFLDSAPIDVTKVKMGRTLKGADVTMNLQGGMKVFPGVIRAGGRSGKGVLTQLLMIYLLGAGAPFVYLDCKPEMALTWNDYGKRMGCKTLAADAMSSNDKFLPEGYVEPSKFLYPCRAAVMNSAGYFDFKDILMFGKIAGLLGGLLSARAERPDVFALNGRNAYRDVFVIIDEVNMMRDKIVKFLGDLETIDDKGSLKSVFDAKEKTEKMLYKKEHKDAVVLPDTHSMMVEDIGPFTMKEWRDVFSGMHSLQNVIRNVIGELGALVASSVQDAPKFKMSTLIIGQTKRIDESGRLGAFKAVVKEFKSAGRMALIGRSWGDIEDGELKSTLNKVPSGRLTDITPGVFLYRQDSGSPKFQIIKTGLLTSRNDVLELDDQMRGDDTGLLLRNMRDTAGAEAAEIFKREKLLVTDEVKSALNAVGIQAEVGDANPLVAFDGLLDYVMRKNGKDSTEPVNWLYDELSKLLKITGAGYTDVYEYLADYSVAYTRADFLGALKSAKPLYQVEEVAASGDSDFAKRVKFDGEQPAESEHTKDKEVSYEMPETPMPENPVRQQSQGIVLPPMPKLDRTAEIETDNADDKYIGAGNEYPVEDDLDVTAPIANDVYADDADAEQSEDYTGAQEEESTEMPGGISAADIADLVRAIAGDDDDDDEDDEPVKVPQAPVPQPVQSKPVQPEQVKSEPVQSKPVQSEPMQSKPVQQKPVQQVIKPQAAPVKARTTAAPPVASHQGAADRRTGSETVRENPDGTYTLAIPKGESKGYYTGVETVQTLNNVFTPSEAGKFSMFASGRMYMSLKCMERLVHMIEEKSGMTRAMIKNLTFADNCIFVRDACVVGGQPDSNELYDYVDIKYFLKAMRGLVQLRMDRDAYFNLIVRPGYKAKAVFQFSKTLNTFAFDKCSLLRDGRIVGEEPNSVKDSFIADFDGLVADNSIATSRSKMFSPRFNRRSERAEAMKHTSEYNERVLHLQKTKMKLYGKKAEEYMESGRHVAGLFARFRMWMIDRKVKKMEDAL